LYEQGGPASFDLACHDSSTGSYETISRDFSCCHTVAS